MKIEIKNTGNQIALYIDGKEASVRANKVLLECDWLFIDGLQSAELGEDQDDRCRVCGCTDLSACDGGCFWVEPGLCSQCSPAEPEDQVHGAGAELEDQVHGAGTEKQKCPECGSEEIEGGSPRTTYSCGSSDYDQRPETFQQSICCCWVSNKKTSEA